MKKTEFIIQSPVSGVVNSSHQLTKITGTVVTRAESRMSAVNSDLKSKSAAHNVRLCFTVGTVQQNTATKVVTFKQRVSGE